MGSSQSLTDAIRSNDYLKQICGHSPHDEKFWKSAKSALSQLNPQSNTPLSLVNDSLIDSILQPLSDSLCWLQFCNAVNCIVGDNNLQTGSLGGLMLMLSEWLCEAIRSSDNVGIYLANGLVLFRHFVHRILVECGNNTTLLEAHFNSFPPGMKSTIGKRSLPELFMESVMRFLCEKKLSEDSYIVHLECVNCLAVLFSTSLYGGITMPVVLSETQSKEVMIEVEDSTVQKKQTKTDRRHNIFLESAIHCKSRHVTVGLVRALLENYISYRMSKTTEKSEESFVKYLVYSIVGTIGSATTTILYLPVNAFKALFSKSDIDENSKEEFPQLLGKRSVMVLLLLLFYRKHDNTITNPYLDALRQCTNFDDVTKKDDIESTTSEVVLASFQRLYTALFSNFDEEMGTLLLYCLLNENPNFFDYVVNRNDLDIAIEAMMHKLYKSPDENPNHVYIMLIILMILTQDNTFNTTINKLSLPKVSWYRERILSDIKLSSLMIIILLKTVQYNIAHQKDIYLDHNCLAIIANMAPVLNDIHPSAAQRLLSLVSMLSKKFIRIQKKEISEEERETYAKFLQILVEAVNCCLTYSLPNNLWLVYELLHQRHIFDNIRLKPMFSNLVANIDLVTYFFDDMMGSENDEDDTMRNWSVEEVMDLLKTGSKKWKGDNLKVYDHFKYTYTEDSNTEDFFVPYIWAIIITQLPCVAWDLESVMIDLPLYEKVEDEEEETETEKKLQDTTSNIDLSSVKDLESGSTSEQQTEITS